MKTKKRGMLLLVLIMAMISMFGISAAAAGNTVNMKKDTNGTFWYANTKGSKGAVYHRFKVNSSGLIAVTGNVYNGQNSGRIQVTVCNSKKKAISNPAYVNGDNDQIVYYGLKKGTYYIKTNVKSAYSAIVSFSKNPDKGGSKKAKARTVKWNNGVVGVMPLGEKSSTADWYKVKVKKNSKMYVEMSNYGTGRLNLQIYGPGLKKGISAKKIGNKTESFYIAQNNSSSAMKLAAGTYYIKISRYDKKASGVYSLYVGDM